MMTKLKEIAPCQKELEVQVPIEEVQAEYEVVYRKIKKTARVPGFRVGAAPQDLLEQYYGDTAKEEVIRRLIQRSMEEALKSQPDLDLVGRPRVTNVQMNPKAPLVYSAQIEVAPALPSGRYKGLRLTRPQLRVAEENVAQVLAHLQETHAQLSPILEPRAAKEGDFLLADLTERLPGKEPKKRRDVLIHLDIQKDELGTMKQLLGMTPGTDRAVTLQDGKSVSVHLKELKVKQMPPIDDAFAKSAGPFEGLEALKEAIRKDLGERAEVEKSRALRDQVVEELLSAWNFEVPPSLVASQARRIVKDRSLSLLSQGVPSAKVEEQAKLLTEQAKLDALKEVKLFFILRRVANEEQVTASNEEVESRVAQLAKRLGLSAEEVRKDLESKDLLDELVWEVIREKVFDFILKEADIKESEEKA